MGEVNVSLALERIDSTILKERVEGLADLKHVLRHNQKSLKNGSIKESPFHKIFDTLFRTASLERSAYLKSLSSSSKSSRSASTTRLSSCSSALRLAIEIGLPNIKIKTVRALIDHLTETILDPVGNCCEPIALDYARSLTLIVSYAPHTEHLSGREWHDVSRFCIDRIRSFSLDLKEDASAGASNRSSRKSAGDSSLGTSRSINAASQAQEPSLSRTLQKQLCSEFTTCLRYLTATPSAPLVPLADSILSTLLQLLDKSSSVGTAGVDAMVVVNNTLARIRGEAITVTKGYVNPLLILAKDLWHSKSGAIKDEALVMLVLMLEYIKDATRDSLQTQVQDAKAVLAETLLQEYSKRPEKEQLQLEDLSLDSLTDMPDVRSAVFELRDGNPRGEHNWTVLRLLTVLSAGPSSYPQDSQPTEKLESSQPVRKRLRRTEWIEELGRMTKDPETSIKICAIQCISFWAQQVPGPVETLLHILEVLIPLVGDKNNNVASWSLLALSSCASQLAAKSGALTELWQTVWQIACRAINAPSTCRTACHLLNIIMNADLVVPQYVHDMMDAVDASIEVNGPAMLSDSSCMYMGNLILRSITDRLPSPDGRVDRFLGWLFQKWSPGSLEDKTLLASQEGLRFDRILDLILLCLAQPRQPLQKQLLPQWGAVALSWFRTADCRPLINYVLLLDDDPRFLIETVSDRAASQDTVAKSGTNTSTHMILTRCNKEIDRALEYLQEVQSTRAGSITRDMVRTISNLVIVASCLQTLLSSEEKHQSKILKEKNDKFVAMLCKHVSTRDCDQDKVDIILDVVCVGQSTVSMDAATATSKLIQHSIAILSGRLFRAIDSRRLASTPDLVDEDSDLMDMDSELESQVSRGGLTSKNLEQLRSTLPALYDMSARRAGGLAYLKLMECSHRCRLGHEDDFHEADTAFSGFVDYIASSDFADIVASRKVLSNLPSLGFCLDPKEVDGLLLHISNKAFRTYNEERSELAMGLVLDFFNSHIDILTNTVDKNLYNQGLDIYEFFTTVALPAEALTSDIKKRLSDLLLELFTREEDYAQNENLPSVRTCLFQILRDSDLRVKYHIAERIEIIFKLFTLPNHDAVFDDLQENLPTDSEWIEGLAVRMFALARLASRWHSLLRRSVYHIFETAGNVNKSTDHAARSILYLSRQLSIDRPQTVFRLFCSQLLYTWLADHRLFDIPFSIFGYDSLKELLEQNHVEVYAQLLLYDKNLEAEQCLLELKRTDKEMIGIGFAKSVAYALSQDISDTHDGSQAACETRIRDLIPSKAEYVSLISENVPAVVAIFFASTQQDTGIEKSLEKRQGYRDAYNALMAMKRFSSFSKPLAASLQPSFKSKYLVDQLDRISRRASKTVAELFDTPDLTIISRIMVDSIHPALGPLHSAQVIHKIRLLVAIAGNSALEGYPTDMLIQTLRPFLKEAQSADDTIGIMHYLYDKGSAYLTLNMPVLIGSAIMTLLSMKTFMESKQDVTTQESQFRYTVSKMQTFHDWLITYLLDRTESIAEGSRERYVALVAACRDMSFPTSILKDCPASTLLFSLLDDGQVSTPILDNVMRRDAIMFVYHKCGVPKTLAEDPFESDKVCLKYASDLWEIMNKSSITGLSASWMGRIVGRAYSTMGSIEVVRSPLNPPSVQQLPPGSAIQSQKIIMVTLTKLLSSNNSRHAGAAERTLRWIIVRHLAIESRDFEQHLPSHVLTALSRTDGGLEFSDAALPVKDSSMARIRRSIMLLGTISDFQTWTRKLAKLLTTCAPRNPILGALPDVLDEVSGIAEDLIPCIIHLALLHEADKEPIVRSMVSELCMDHFKSDLDPQSRKIRLLLNSVLYLFTQPSVGERIRPDRQGWLALDFLIAAEAAARCSMPATALYLAENGPPSESGTRSSRRSFAANEDAAVPLNELLLQIYKSIDDPDALYGVEQPANLYSVAERLGHEGDGLKALVMNSAQLDASLRNENSDDQIELLGTVKALGVLNLDSLVHLLLDQRRKVSAEDSALATMSETARRLGQWDVPLAKASSTTSGLLFTALQGFRKTASAVNLQTQLAHSFSRTIQRLRDPRTNVESTRSSLRALTVLTEIDAAAQIKGAEDLCSSLEHGYRKQTEWDIGQYHESLELMSYRETIFGILRRNVQLHEAMHLRTADCFDAEIRAVINTSALSRRHGLTQQSLTAATYLSSLVPQCEALGLNVDSAAQYEVASTLWKQGEMATSVKMLQQLLDSKDLDTQYLTVGRAGMLAQMGHQVAAARLEKPEEVIARYLKPAIKQLQKSTTPEEAGQAFYEFASFCDQQLQNPGNLEDFRRLQLLRQRKYDEMKQLETLYHATPASQKDVRAEIYRSRTKTKMWFTLDDNEYKAAVAARDEFVQQSLTNYLRALQGCDNHDASVVRFFALWLEYSDSETANKAVQRYLDEVPSWKFVVLLNQQMSRLLKEDSTFQALLSKLITRICADHPYHSIHHVFSSCNSAVGDKDEVAQSRKAAANKIAARIQADKRVGSLFNKVWEASGLYHRLAAHRVENSKTTKFTIRQVQPAYRMSKRVTELTVPPATLSVELRPVGDYTGIPVVTGFRDEISIASGLSAPKILTARASDGARYRQLFKGGNDDLRQDAIMEQVFGEVSKILKKHRSTRQRNLHVRTYKVLPLSSTSGIIEFVPDSIPLHDFVVPAHAKYNPNDMKWTNAREAIKNVQANSKEQRVTVYRNVTKKYTPVLRHFFLERFEDPDDWFKRRLAYTRSTAAISMLGYVLGLGDRHCHNILLDEKSGEVIHIDLGVAFETGRVLPVPEVVPFRLTRDIVDGMGITKTEGTFRRCCEFTMEALREDKDSIMTLLNVLRYDPLYSWTVSPLRAKKMQDAQDEAKGVDQVEKAGEESKRNDNEAGEAERALAVVEKKLSKTLSTAATVNELIQQATDERNLAVLFAGWAAYS